MVFRTVNIQKGRSGTDSKCCDYIFELYINVNEEKGSISDILWYALEVFQNKRYAKICAYQLTDNNIVKFQVKECTDRRQRRFIKDMKKFAYRLLDRTGILYSFKIE